MLLFLQSKYVNDSLHRFVDIDNRNYLHTNTTSLFAARQGSIKIT